MRGVAQSMHAPLPGYNIKKERKQVGEAIIMWMIEFARAWPDH